MIAFILHHRNNPSDTGVISMVQDSRKYLHQFIEDNYDLLRSEIERWRDILAVPYAQYKSKDVLK